MVIKGMLRKIAAIAEQRVEKYGARYTAFGIFSALSFVLPLYMWTATTGGHASVVVMRVMCVIMGFLLSVHTIWKPPFKKYLPLFWFVAVTFSVPFITTYMIILDGLSMFWVLNIAIALILGMILLDFRSFLVTFPIGIFLAFFYSMLSGNRLQRAHITSEGIFFALYLLFFVFIISFVFFKNKEKEQSDKIKAMKNLAGAIVHEIRTPLCAIRMNVNNLYKVTNKESEDKIKKSILDNLNYLNSTIEMTLAKLRNQHDVPCEYISISECIKFAMDMYPFDQDEREKLHLDIKDDYTLHCNKNLMSQVLFNLLHNAFHQIKIDRKGEIFITTRSIKDKKHILSVKDTANGIDKHSASVFEPFNSKKNNGTGIGLFFCKTSIRSMNGCIRCESINGKFTEFIMEF